jgi:TatD DNase family protein
MKIVDVHCHLESMRFRDDLDEVIGRFKDAGGEVVICSGTNPERNKEVLELSKRFDCVKCSFGLYPVGNFSKDIEAELNWIRENKDSCVAVGECGMDFDGESREINSERQADLFRRQIDLAMELDLPLVIHSRKAEKECIDILESKGAKKVVMHCFCGKKSLIKRGVELGFYFSVPPAITRWNNFKMLVEEVPLGQLLTETDAPYLGPVARERNEPANVLVTIKEIAKIKGLSEEEVLGQLRENAKRVFGV